MKNIPVNFFKEHISFRLANQAGLKKWVLMIIKENDYSLNNINFIFCNDVYIRKINREYLKHDYSTDIITFDNSSERQTIESDIFISIETVRRNSTLYSKSFSAELNRVMIHGIFHLLGFSDKTKKDIQVMRAKEDLAIQKL